MFKKIVDRSKDTPLYIQIVNYWEEKIKKEELEPGEQMPTEKGLIELHQVSRMTVKQAIRTLVERGLVETTQGKGTFVSKKKHQWELTKLHSFSEDMRKRGFKPGSKILKKEICKGPVPELNLESNKALTIRTKRLRLADGEPMAIEIMHIEYDLFSDIYDEIEEGVSMYNLMEEGAGISLYYANEFLETKLPTEEEVELLKIDEYTPVFRLQRISYTKDGKPIELTNSVYRGDQYRFRFTLER